VAQAASQQTLLAAVAVAQRRSDKITASTRQAMAAQAQTYQPSLAAQHYFTVQAAAAVQ
jgi:hypothetical protein